MSKSGFHYRCFPLMHVFPPFYSLDLCCVWRTSCNKTCKGHTVLKTLNKGKGHCLSFIQEVWRRESEDFSRLTVHNKKTACMFVIVIFSRPPTIQPRVTPLPLNVSQNKFKSNLKPVSYLVFLCKRYNLPCQMKCFPNQMAVSHLSIE